MESWGEVVDSNGDKYGEYLVKLDEEDVKCCASCRCLGDLRVEGEEKHVQTVIVLYVQLVRHDPCDSLVSVSERAQGPCSATTAKQTSTPPHLPPLPRAGR